MDNNLNGHSTAQERAGQLWACSCAAGRRKALGSALAAVEKGSTCQYVIDYLSYLWLSEDNNVLELQKSYFCNYSWSRTKTNMPLNIKL